MIPVKILKLVLKVSELQKLRISPILIWITSTIVRQCGLLRRKYNIAVGRIEILLNRCSEQEAYIKLKKYVFNLLRKEQVVQNLHLVHKTEMKEENDQPRNMAAKLSEGWSLFNGK